MRIGSLDLDMSRTHIMGILNVTPDSFSDGGMWHRTDAALRRAEQMIKEGAEIIDIGGESTRPGYTPVDADEEIRRITPVIQAIKKEFTVPISADTYKSRVAAAALDAGADMINDIWGLKHDSDMADVINRFNVPACLMHNRRETVYTDFIADVISDLKESINIAETAGIPKNKLILDPGVGFAKTQEQNLEIINRLDELLPLGCPILLGASRKSVIGNALELPTEERLEGTLATTVIAVMRGAAFVRVHDIKENLRAIRMAEAILTIKHSGI